MDRELRVRGWYRDWLWVNCAPDGIRIGIKSGSEELYIILPPKEARKVVKMMHTLLKGFEDV